MRHSGSSAIKAKVALCWNCFTLLMARRKSGWAYGHTKSVILGHGLGEITVGKLARLANGSALAKCGETSILVTVVSDFSATSEDSFLPLTVDFRQKASAAGRIPTNFLRRELGQSQDEILTSRKIDRSVRPMFPEQFSCETQIVCNLMAYDRVHQADVLAINAASTALAVSSIPWNGPVGAVRVGYVNDKPVLNPSRGEMLESKLDVIVTANSEEKIVMIEGGAKELPIHHLKAAISFGAKHAADVSRKICGLINEINPKKQTTPSQVTQATTVLSDWIIRNYLDSLIGIFTNAGYNKLSRDNAVNQLKSDCLRASALDPDLSGITRTVITAEFNKFSKAVLRELILEKRLRPDGRSVDQVRNIGCEVNLYPPLHGSALFQRGQTQVMSTVTLDSLESMAKTDAVTEILVGRSEKNFMLHYEFPQFATGDLGKVGSVNRREIGHGALAERALTPIIPKDFPFTIRVTSEVLESNGSSSMASVCAGSLALLDAGVPLKTSAAGIAMGLIADRSPQNDLSRYVILTDILGLEDYAGDMDFKIAGTAEGVTALQVDFKIPGVNSDLISEIITQSQEGLRTILSKMADCISQPRADRKDNWPVSETFPVPISKRSKIIGLSGVNIKNIQRQTGVTISTDSELNFKMYAHNQASMEQAKKLMQDLIDKQKAPDLEFGNVYTGKIVELLKNGARVQIHPSMEPVFVKNSQLDTKTIYHSEASGLLVGDSIPLKYFGTDPVSGEERWSRRALLSEGGYSKHFLPKEEKPYYKSPK